MKKNYLFLLFLLFSFQAFAQGSAPATTPTQPTEASHPIPKLSETKNPDTVLSEKVQTAINNDAFLKGQAVSAASVEGKITLQGSVQTKEQENQAIKVTKSVPGVIEVTSQLTVQTGK